MLILLPSNDKLLSPGNKVWAAHFYKPPFFDKINSFIKGKTCRGIIDTDLIFACSNLTLPYHCFCGTKNLKCQSL